MGRKFNLFIIIFFTLPTILALNISLNYPDELPLDKEITFTLTLNEPTGEIYDTKIDIQNRDGKRIARILNDKIFKSTIYYIPSSISTENNFIIKFLEDPNNAIITVKLRDNKGNILTFPIEKIEISTKKEPQKEKKESIEKEEIFIKEEIIKEDKNELIKPIALNPQTFKNTENFQIKENKDYSGYYLLIAFCIILIGLYTIRGKKQKNEWR